MTDLVRIGSETAKGGFANERDIARKFENWKQDKEAQKWLQIMDYNLKEIKKVETVILPNKYKADIQVKVIVTLKDAISVQNISIKKTNDDADFNQIDKRKVEKYVELWNMPQDVAYLLRVFCGEISPKELLDDGKVTQQKYNSLKDKLRFFMGEFEDKDKEKIVNFFKKNKILILTDIIKGRDKFSAAWILVTKYNQAHNETTWILADINKALNIFGEGEVEISPRGSISIGRITLQRKGGDGGRDTGKMLQFKIKPCDLFRY